MAADKQISEFSSQLTQLQNLLKRQIELARQGSFDSFEIETLSKQADSLVEKITQAGILELPEFKNQRKQLRKLYNTLSLAITAQKAETTVKLSHLRKTKKTLETYRSNI